MTSERKLMIPFDVATGKLERYRKRPYQNRKNEFLPSQKQRIAHKKLQKFIKNGRTFGISPALVPFQVIKETDQAAKSAFLESA
jgi:hypothetical protein